MTLAAMVDADEDALICDLAEIYGVLNYKALPVKLLATLACGLRENSRIRMKMANLAVAQDVLLMAAAVDKLSFLAWAQTTDGQKGRNRPKAILPLFWGEKEAESQFLTFDNGADFEKARETIMKRG